ncbi:hypothetical protein CRUP_004878 [Coryphaenoides rupestris]|nr:hypothetical protein CRUP_004878 [Coryphaenoides rupestris]
MADTLEGLLYYHTYDRVFLGCTSDAGDIERRGKRGGGGGRASSLSSSGHLGILARDHPVMAAQTTASSSTDTISELTRPWDPNNTTPAVAVVAAATTTADSTVAGYHMALLFIYVAVLLSGTAGLVLALRVLRSHALSVTTVAVLNLIFAHFLFLVTVPFRVYYYAAGHWYLGPNWCKASAA